MPVDRIAALRTLMSRRPDDPRLRFGLALEYLGAGRTDEGVEELKRYLAVADDEGNAWGRLGAALRLLGRDDEAKAGLRQGHRGGVPARPPVHGRGVRGVDGGLGAADAGCDADKRASFEREALPHMDAVYRFALRLTGSPDQAQDLVQDTFLRAFRSWDQYTPGTQCKSWLFTICRNLYLRQRERGQRHDEIVEENAPRDQGGEAGQSPLVGGGRDGPGRRLLRVHRGRRRC